MEGLAAAVMAPALLEPRVGMPDIAVEVAVTVESVDAKKKRDQSAKNARRPKRKEMAQEILVNLREKEAKRKRETYVPRGASEEEAKRILENAERNRVKAGPKLPPPPPGDCPPLPIAMALPLPLQPPQQPPVPVPPPPPGQEPEPRVGMPDLAQDLAPPRPAVVRARRVVDPDSPGKKARDQSAKNARRPKRKDLTPELLGKVREHEAKRKRDLYVPKGEKRALVVPPLLPTKCLVARLRA
jgi:hypothetical protein